MASPDRPIDTRGTDHDEGGYGGVVMDSDGLSLRQELDQGSVRSGVYGLNDTDSRYDDRFAYAIKLADSLRSALSGVLLGADHAVLAAVLAMLSGSHLLVEDVPGVGKTLLAKALAMAVQSSHSRVQGHPDLLPSDITGVSVYLPDKGSWEVRKGPLFASIVLFDELNRTPPRTQAALLEAMAERQVTIDGSSLALPSPHMVIATQNPLSELGTFPLVESQLDRFGVCTTIGYPDEVTEVELSLSHGGENALPGLSAVCDSNGWSYAQDAVRAVTVVEKVAEMAVRLCRETRTHRHVMLGASPRAAITLTRVAQAYALVSGRTYVIPDDVKAVAHGVLRHRLLTDGVSGREVVGELLATMVVPRP